MCYSGRQQQAVHKDPIDEESERADWRAWRSDRSLRVAVTELWASKNIQAQTQTKTPNRVTGFFGFFFFTGTVDYNTWYEYDINMSTHTRLYRTRTRVTRVLYILDIVV